MSVYYLHYYSVEIRYLCLGAVNSEVAEHFELPESSERGHSSSLFLPR